MNRIRLTDGELTELAARIQRNYDYDEASGRLINAKTNKVVRGYKSARRNGVCRYLYFDFFINGKRYSIRMHKIVWVWHHGYFPTLQIDHINGDGMDNRIENLREVTQSENMLNQRREWKPNPKTGLPGVYQNRGGYQISAAGKRYFFQDKFEAFYHLTLLGRRFK